MNNSLNFQTNDIIKYAIVLGVVYYILKKVPSESINNKDLILILIVFTAGFMFINGCNNSEYFSDMSDMSNMPPTPNMPITPVEGVSSNIINTQDMVPEANQMSQPAIGCTLEVNKIKDEFQRQIDLLKSNMNNQNQEQNDNAVLVQSYLNNLLTELNKSGLLSPNDIQNIQSKLKNRLLTVAEVIKGLERLKIEGVSQSLNPINSGNAINSGEMAANAAPVMNMSGPIVKEISNFANTDAATGNTGNVNIVKNDMVYNELPAGFFTPLGDKIANEWDENEYTILNTDKWRVPMQQPPVCINAAPCTVCPSDAGAYFPVSLKNWDKSRYVTQNTVNQAWAKDQVVKTQQLQPPIVKPATIPDVTAHVV